MSPPSKLAVAAARMALRCAGFADARCDAARTTSVVVATTFGPSSYSEALLRQILFEGPEATSPFYFTESVANAPAAQIAIALPGAGAERDRLPAGGRAAHRPGPGRRGGGRGPGAARPGRRRRGDDAAPPRPARPLRRAGAPRAGREPSRRGRSTGGATGSWRPRGRPMVHLETEESALARGARPLARVLAWGSAFDPTAPPDRLGDRRRHGSPARSAAAWSGPAWRSADIDRIVSGASGSRDGDRLEAGLLRAAWGEQASCPRSLAPKATVGEYGGGFLGRRGAGGRRRAVRSDRRVRRARSGARDRPARRERPCRRRPPSSSPAWPRGAPPPGWSWEGPPTIPSMQRTACASPPSSRPTRPRLRWATVVRGTLALLLRGPGARRRLDRRHGRGGAPGRGAGDLVLRRTAARARPCAPPSPTSSAAASTASSPSTPTASTCPRRSPSCSPRRRRPTWCSACATTSSPR